jgi:phosphopantothenoylcysteine synthetase/decarboxylase
LQKGGFLWLDPWHMSSPDFRRVVVTCGPSYEPIDEVRRITNHSTGKLGIRLSNRLSAEGWQVTCLKGIGALHPEPLAPEVELVRFSTNDHLLERMQALPNREQVSAVFHAAALCDFKVRAVQDEVGESVGTAKLSSRVGELTLILQPATKIIGHLQPLFPNARVVGWKYELEDSREEVIAKGARQLRENGSALCVLNGRAYGSGFGALRPDGTLTEIEGYDPLCEWLCEWLASAT